jgi:hypothetical protein
MGLEADVHAHLRQGIEDQARRLEAVRRGAIRLAIVDKRYNARPIHERLALRR